MFGSKKTKTESDALVQVDSSALLPFQAFADLLAKVEQECRGIGCGYARRRCRTAKTKEVFGAWWSANANGNGHLQYDVEEALEQVLPGYFRERWAHKKTGDLLTAFRRETYGLLKPRLDRIAAAA